MSKYTPVVRTCSLSFLTENDYINYVSIIMEYRLPRRINMSIAHQTNSGFSLTRWVIILIYLAITVVSPFWNTPISQAVLPILIVVSIFSAVCLHGKARYGAKNIVVFFLITWLVSHFFEALSIQMGFPFGFYYYDQLAGPRLFQVPLIIMFAYFGMGYASWSLANVLLDTSNNKLTGKQVVYVPLIASFIMVMWDLCMDPTASTVSSLWVWRDGGAYFGVPLQNYFGWFFVVYIIFQLFAVYIARYDAMTNFQLKIFSRKIFWMEVVAIYAIQALRQLLDPLGVSDHQHIYDSMALVTFFSMGFVVILAYAHIRNSKALD